MLHVMPPPDAADIAARTLREPMDLTARRRFLRRHRLSLILLVIGYMCLMTYRDVRDTFQVDILRELGVTASAARLAGIETQVGIAVIIALGLFALIRSNRYAYIACCVLISGGGLLTGISTLMLQQGNLSPQTWMTVTGIGLYAAFVPYQAILFERLLASTRTVGTAAFLIALCDSYGYLSTIILYFYKALFGGAGMSWVRVLSGGGYALGIAVPVLLLTAAALSARKPKALQAPAPAPAPAWLFLL